jgi:excisionase family DNA binding protein
MHGRHSVQDMQQSQAVTGSPRPLLTALEVQQLLQIDRSTVYRMAEDGRLPAIRVGRSWRFPAERIEALLAAEAPEPDDAPLAPLAPTPAPAPLASTPLASPLASPLAPAPLAMIHSGSGPKRDHNVHGSRAEGELDLSAARAAVEVAADLLGVMMVVTDMTGRPVTAVANPCTWFAARAGEPGVLDQCVTEWRDLADHPDLSPRFQPGALGFECARAFIRDGSTLVGMVLAGGVSPSTEPGTDPDLYHLDGEQRERVLVALPRIAAAIATRSPDPTPTIAPVGAVTKEN